MTTITLDTKLRKGDKLIYTKEAKSEIESRNWCEFVGLQLGEVVTVEEDLGGGWFREKARGWHAYGYNFVKDHFMRMSEIRDDEKQ